MRWTDIFPAPLLVGALLIPIPANATLISGFESALDGWEHVGDVSVQDSDFGIDATQGRQFGLVTTLCDSQAAQRPLECQTTNREIPYSGVNSPKAFDGGIAPPGPSAAEFLGLTRSSFIEQVRPVDFLSLAGESGALRTRFFAPAASTLLFDWNHLSLEGGDMSYFTVWSDDASTPWRLTDYLYVLGGGTSLLPGDVRLCERTILTTDETQTLCDLGFQTGESGWQTRSVAIEAPGWYWLGFGLGELAEGTISSALAIDNVRFNVPEPDTLALFGLGLIGLGFARRRQIRTEGT